MPSRKLADLNLGIQLYSLLDLLQWIGQEGGTVLLPGFAINW